MKVRFKRMYSDAVIPSFAYGDELNAGLDLYAYILPSRHLANITISGDLVLEVGASVNIGTGVAWEPGEFLHEVPVGPDLAKVEKVNGWKPALIIKGRSGLAIRHGIEASNAGVVDAGYRGEIMVRLTNTGRERYVIQHGDRIAQGLVILMPVVHVEEAVELSATGRGESGFWSSGK